jgi:hypothetical protein
MHLGIIRFVKYSSTSCRQRREKKQITNEQKVTIPKFTMRWISIVGKAPRWGKMQFFQGTFSCY